jgi:hypothetical protein
MIPDYTMRKKNKVTEKMQKERSVFVETLVRNGTPRAEIANRVVSELGMDRNEAYIKIRYWLMKVKEEREDDQIV